MASKPSAVEDVVIETPDASVWVTVVDPETEDGRAATKAWDEGQPSEWAVPANAKAGDLVLAWLTGGTGFRYLLAISGSPRPPAKDEFGPQQANLRTLQRIDPAVPMTSLKSDRALSAWWLIRANMQGAVRGQRQSLTRDPEWPSFLRLLDAAAPRAAARLRAVSQPPPSSTPSEIPPAIDTVTLVDEGSATPVHVAVTRELGNVLARAAAINDGRESFDLSFSSLLLGLCYGDEPTGQWMADYFTEQGIRIEHALSKVRTDDAKARAAAAGATKDRDAILAKPLRRTVSARQAFDEAAKIADAQPAKYLDTKHLVAALISLTDYHEEDFGALALDRARWGAAFVAHVARRTSDAAEIAFWRRFYERRFPGHALPPLEGAHRGGRRPDYDADAYSARDLLSIDDEVAALASVIASRQTRPPLAVGLFGDWGSGKTFFMKHLRRRIDQLCEGARAQKIAERECHGHIAQIEFNAWHYQEGDLWASLIDHILRNLRFGEDEEDARVSERRDQVLRELDVTEAKQQAAAARATAADKRVNDAEERVAELKAQEQERREELAQTLTPAQLLSAARTAVSVDPALRQKGEELAQILGIPVAEKSAVDLRDALSDARRELAGASAFLIPLLRAKDRKVRGLLLAAAVATPIVLAFLVHWLLGRVELLARIGAVVAGVGSFLATATTWLSGQTTWVRRVRERIEPVARDINKAVDDGIEQALSKEKAAIANKIAEIDALREEQTRALKERDEAAAQAAALKNTLATLGDDGLMRAFLDERIGGGVYQQKLGIAALVRRDFDRLSRKIEKVTEREYADTLKPGELVINRIVLYIDDLDRCDMDKIVPVLRAVHLLLAFPAFVVVVGVDSRWVAHCLEKHLQNSVDVEGTVTPLDYLEKIFQIPIWLEPIPPDRRVAMAQTLLRRPVVVERTEEKSEEPVPEDRTPRQQTDDAKTAGQRVPDPQPTREAAAKTEPPPTQVDGPPLDLNPPGLRITDAEYAFIDELGGLLSSSPRVLKRFVNTYRLINATIAQTGVQDVERQPQDSEIRMFLLAVLVGMPELSRWLQDALRKTSPEHFHRSLAEVLHGAEEPGDRTRGQWDAVDQWMSERREPWTKVPAARFDEWLNRVGRYTFNLSRSFTNR
jgi:KAP-like P-loop domain-containing protein